MVRIIILALVLLFVFVSATSSQDCRVALQQRQRSAWDFKGVQLSLYDVFIHNTGAIPMSNVSLTSSHEFESIWAVDHAGDNTYGLPYWRYFTGGVQPKETHNLGYVIKGTQPADLTIHPNCEQETSSESEAETESGSDSASESVEVTEDEDIVVGHKQRRSARAHRPTKAPTKAPTHSPTTHSPTTHSATKAPTTTTKAPTATTKAPATSAPTTTKAPTTTTKAPATSAPSTTKAPTTTTKAPSTSAPTTGGTLCAAGGWWAPAPQTTYQWQLTGTIDTSVNVQMYDIDLFDNTAATISTLHSQGRAVICYFSTQYENWRPDASSFTSAVLGNNLDDWAGEKYVDIRSTVVRNIMTARMDLAVSKGCDGLEPDNVDGYEANTGFPLTAADQLNFNEFIAAQAHSRGLSVGLKNDVDQASQLQPYFDWALNEQCYEYSECNTLSSFISAGKAVFNTEYSGSASSICPYMVGIKFTSLLKDLNLDASIKAECCTYQSNGCAAVAHTCKTS